MSKTGIILAQLGGPRDQREVEPFVRAIFADPDLVPIPGGPVVSKVFGWAVAKARGPFVRKNYRLIGGGSPILEITLAQGRMLEETLLDEGYVPTGVSDGGEAIEKIRQTVTKEEIEHTMKTFEKDLLEVPILV